MSICLYLYTVARDALCAESTSTAVVQQRCWNGSIFVMPVGRFLLPGNVALVPRFLQGLGADTVGLACRQLKHFLSQFCNEKFHGFQSDFREAILKVFGKTKPGGESESCSRFLICSLKPPAFVLVCLGVKSTFACCLSIFAAEHSSSAQNVNASQTAALFCFSHTSDCGAVTP